MKKILLGLGTLATAIIPVVAVVACGTNAKVHTESSQDSKSNNGVVPKKQEAPKQEAPKQEAPKQEAPKQEAPKQEAPNQVGNAQVEARHSSNEIVKAPQVIVAPELPKMNIPERIFEDMEPPKLKEVVPNILKEFKMDLEKRFSLFDHKKIKSRQQFMQNQINGELDSFIGYVLSQTPDAYDLQDPQGGNHLLGDIQTLVNNTKDSIVITGGETQEEFSNLLKTKESNFKLALNILLSNAKEELIKKLQKAQDIYSGPLSKDPRFEETNNMEHAIVNVENEIVSSVPKVSKVIEEQVDKDKDYLSILAEAGIEKNELNVLKLDPQLLRKARLFGLTPDSEINQEDYQNLINELKSKADMAREALK